MKTVLITGAGRGIGRALAYKYAKEGYKVLCTVRNMEESDLSPEYTPFILDLASNESIERCTSDIIAGGHKIDILVNNAGTLLDEDDTHVIVDKLRMTIEVNLIGTVDFTERLIPAMNDGGHIINISSTAGSLGLAGDLTKTHFPYHYPAYKISKCALNMYTRVLALRMENEKKGITVSSVHPGWVKSAMGGDEAPVTCEEAATNIFTFSNSKPASGKFWFNGTELPW